MNECQHLGGDVCPHCRPEYYRPTSDVQKLQACLATIEAATVELATLRQAFNDVSAENKRLKAVIAQMADEGPLLQSSGSLSTPHLLTYAGFKWVPLERAKEAEAEVERLKAWQADAALAPDAGQVPECEICETKTAAYWICPQCYSKLLKPKSKPDGTCEHGNDPRHCLSVGCGQ